MTKNVIASKIAMPDRMQTNLYISLDNKLFEVESDYDKIAIYPKAV